jgi:hypothetical protein
MKYLKIYISLGVSNKNNIMEGKCGTNWRDEKCTHNFSRKTQSKKQRGRQRRRWDVNIKVDLK